MDEFSVHKVGWTNEAVIILRPSRCQLPIAKWRIDV